ncbi:MAG: tail fiber domain-containing protein [Candidatus Binatia bacterium]
MGKGGPATTTQISKVELPKWVESASEENYQMAKDVAGRPLVQYGGQRVADPSAMTTEGYNYLMKNIGGSDPIYEDAYNTYGNAAGKYNEAFDVYKGTTGDLNVQKYLNPYIENVENRAIDSANRSLTTQLAGAEAKAKSAGAFGGSRGAIEQAVTRGEGIRNIGDISAQLRKAGFDTATQTALEDRAGIRNAAGGMANVAGGLNTTAGGLTSLGQNRQQSMLADVAAMFGAGQNEQAQRQALIDADMAKFQEARDYPLEQLNTRLAALGMSPYGKTETSTKTGKSESSGPDWATAGLGVLKMLPALAAMSDRTEKTDIRRVGKKKGVPIYSYRYKGDPKTYPKLVGPMAQDIEKVRPESVRTVGGKKIVDIATMMEFLDA